MESISTILPIIACSSVIFITTLNLYFKIRPKFAVSVNCWFCNQNSSVPYGNRNCWDCPNCDQYNGFLSDGSYNKAIPAQHDECLNHPVTAAPSNEKGPSKGNALCRKCNINQELKIQQLASFSPVNPSQFDEEVDLYRRYLDRVYRLCPACELVLKQTLRKQRSWLLGLRLLQQRGEALHKKVSLSARAAPWWLIRPIFALLGAWLTLAYALRLSDTPAWLPADPRLQRWLSLSYELHATAAGALAQVLAMRWGGPRVLADIPALVMWGQLHVQAWLPRTWQPLHSYISPLDYGMLQVSVAFAALVFSVWASLANRSRFSPVRRNLKHLVDRWDPPITRSLDFSEEEAEVPDCPEPRKEPSPEPQRSPPEPLKPGEAGSGDLNRGFGNLNLGHGPRGPLLHPSKLGPLPSARPILSPIPRKSITQASWVAGGYWHHPLHGGPFSGGFATPLSRSSSQSSGFGSVSDEKQPPYGPNPGFYPSPWYPQFYPPTMWGPYSPPHPALSHHAPSRSSGRSSNQSMRGSPAKQSTPAPQAWGTTFLIALVCLCLVLNSVVLGIFALNQWKLSIST